jgi:hypothetical protein
VERTPPESPFRTGRRASGRARLALLVAVVTLLGLAHHVDHIVRGNHVGWPLTPRVTGFTYSLVVYPLIALGAYLWVRGRAGPGYWALLSAAGFAFVGLTHLGPFALEPPRDIIEVYPSRALGWAAFGLLVVFLTALAAAAAYATALWQRERPAGREGRAASRPRGE